MTFVLCLAAAAPLLGASEPPRDPNRPDVRESYRMPWHDDPNTPLHQDAKALEILKAGIKALGGEQAILGRQTIYIKRKVINHDYPEPREGTITIWYRRPNKLRKEINYPPSPTQVEAFDGEKAWMNDGKQTKVYASAGRAAAILDGMQDLDMPANYLDADLTYFNISQEIPGKLAHVVKVRKNGYTTELMFDVTTNLLAVAGQYENPWGATDKMSRYDRYRPVDGVLVPFREERWRSNQMVTETEILEVKFNGPIDDSMFQMPAVASR